MEITEIEHINTDQCWAEASTTYWFKINQAQDDPETYGVVDQGGNLTLVDCDGFPESPESQNLLTVLIPHYETLRDTR